MGFSSTAAETAFASWLSGNCSTSGASIAATESLHETRLSGSGACRSSSTTYGRITRVVSRCGCRSDGGTAGMFLGLSSEHVG